MASTRDSFKSGSFVREGPPTVVSPRDERRQVTNLDEWLTWAGPLRGELHWADGRSAKEVAKAWLGSDGTVAVPPDLQSLLNCNATLGELRVATVIPELPTPLGDVPSGPRRHDLVLLASDTKGRPTLIGVEAKADEAFDEPVAVRVAQARKAAAAAAEEERAFESAQLPRIERLSRTLFGRPALLEDGSPAPEIGVLPYQLLAATAGTLIEASTRGAEQAVFVVHAFHSESLDRDRLAANDAGYARFLAALPGGTTLAPSYGLLHGPLQVPGGEGVPGMPLYVGITSTTLAT